MKQIKTSVVVILTIALFLTNAGCVSNIKDFGTNSTKEQLSNPDITLYALFDPGFKQDGEAKDAKQWFEKTYGGKIKLKSPSWGEYPIILMSLISSGNAPDFTQFYDWFFPSFEVKKMIQPIDTYIKINDPLYNINAMKMFKWKGMYSMIAGDTATFPNIIIYNKTMFDDNGLKTPRQNFDEGVWNWNNFRKAGMMLTQDTNKDGNVDQWGFSFWSLEVLPLDNNASYVKFNKDGSISPTWGEPNMLEGLQFLQDAFSKDKWMDPTGSFFLTGFPEGKVAMTVGDENFDLNYLQGFKNQFQVDIVPMPFGPHGIKGVTGGSIFGWSIVNKAKNPLGAVIFINKLLEIGREYSDGKRLVNNSSKRIFSKEQLDFLKKIRKTYKVIPLLMQGIGNWGSIYGTALGEVYTGTPPASVIEKYTPQLKNEINACLDDKIPAIEPFAPLLPEDFESGTLGILTTKDCFDYTSIELTKDSSEIISKSYSLKIVAPADKPSVDIRTDETKVKLPSFHSYHVTFDYKFIKGTAADGKFSVVIRPKANIKDAAVNFVSSADLMGKDGESGKYAGDIIVDSQQTDCVLVITNDKGGTVIIDNLAIAEN